MDTTEELRSVRARVTLRDHQQLRDTLATIEGQGWSGAAARPAAELPGLDLGATLARPKPVCAWTGGHWDLGDGEQRRWNGLQNTPSDVRLLTNHLLRALK